MKKLFVICSWALLLGGCKSESGASDPDGDKPVPPPSAELLQKIEDLNAGLVSLKTLAGAVSQSEVRSLAETVACNAAAEAPLIGIAVDGDAYYWTLAAEKDIPWLKDGAGAKMPVSGPVPVVGRDDKGFWTVTTDAAVTPWQIGDGSGNPVEATGDELRGRPTAMWFRRPERMFSMPGYAETEPAKGSDSSRRSRWRTA